MPVYVSVVKYSSCTVWLGDVSVHMSEMCQFTCLTCVSSLVWDVSAQDESVSLRKVESSYIFHGDGNTFFCYSWCTYHCRNSFRVRNLLHAWGNRSSTFLMFQRLEMEFLDIILTKDSSILLHAIHSPFYCTGGFQRKPYSYLVLKIITKYPRNKKTRVYS